MDMTARVFGPWVHPSVGADAALASRHVSVIASHVLGGLVAALVLATHLATAGSPSLAAVAALLVFAIPVGIALHLSRTGRLDIAHLFSAIQLATVVGLVAAWTGGTNSFAIAWLALVPLEAALSGRARITAVAATIAVGVVLALEAAAIGSVLPAPVALPLDAATLTLVANMGAVLYAGAVAASVVRLQRAARRDIEASRERFRLIAENTGDLVTRHTVDGRIDFASLASRTVLGLGADELTAKGFAAALEGADDRRLAAAIARCLATGEPATEEFRIARRSDGGTTPDEAWVEMRLQRVGAAGSGEATVVAVTRDISKRKADEAIVAAARDEAERASRAKTAFLATMSHELRTPLSAIIGFAEILHRELLIKAREPKHAEYCRMIHQSGEHLLSIVKDLLDVSKIESGKLAIVTEPFALCDIARMSVETVRPQAMAKEITLVADVPHDLPEVLADRRATRQVLINLLSNAVKFTPPRGRVSLQARAAGSMIEITVADTGIGIAAEHIERLGRPFYQVETSYARQNEGAGLGLSIVRGIVELSGGKLAIESEPGKGSRFMVALPIDHSEATPMAIATISETSAAPQLAGNVIDLADIHAQRSRRAGAADADADIAAADRGVRAAAG